MNSNFFSFIMQPNACNCYAFNLRISSLDDLLGRLGTMGSEWRISRKKGKRKKGRINFFFKVALSVSAIFAKTDTKKYHDISKSGENRQLKICQNVQKAWLFRIELIKIRHFVALLTNFDLNRAQIRAIFASMVHYKSVANK